MYCLADSTRETRRAVPFRQRRSRLFHSGPLPPVRLLIPAALRAAGSEEDDGPRWDARSSMTVLQATDVYKSYPQGDRLIEAVRGVSLSLAAGDVVAVVGPSGCGKSTLLHLCGAMDRPSGGEVQLEGQSLTALDDDHLTRVRRDRVGFVFQFFNLLPTLTVGQNIGLPLLLSGYAEREVTHRVTALCERVGMSSRVGHFPPQLSGGEAQRAAIARAVVHEPALLIADEPTGNLDSDNGARVLELLLELNARSSTAMLLATHDEQVAAAAQRVIQMRDGMIVESGTQPSAPREGIS